MTLEERIIDAAKSGGGVFYDLGYDIMRAVGCEKKDNGLLGRRLHEWWEYPDGKRIEKTYPFHKIDDAVALCEAVLPNPRWSVASSMAEVNGHCSLKRGAPAMMLCHALCRATGADTQIVT